MGKGTCEKGYESHITMKDAKPHIFGHGESNKAGHPKASVSKVSSESGNSNKEKV